MKFPTSALLLAASAFVLTASLGAMAQNAIKPIPKPSERRIGELEGWDDKPKKEVKGEKKSTAAKAGKSHKSEKTSDEQVPNGGIPLPSNSRGSDVSSPVGFDKNGNLGTGLKF